MGMKIKKIVWFIGTIEDLKFLNRFSVNFEGEIDVFYINLIPWILDVFTRRRKVLPRLHKSDSIFSFSVISEGVFNVQSGRLSKNDALMAYTATWLRLSERYKETKNLLFMIPSGRHVHHLAATRYAIENDIDKLYINYSNFPGFTVFDPEGTDCESLIAKEAGVLNRLFPKYESSNQVKEIFEKFTQLKQGQKVLPQRHKPGFRELIKKCAFRLESILQKTTEIYSDRRHYPKLSNGTCVGKIKKDLPALIYKSPEKECPFAFFPLQVSTDQQVLVNYNKHSLHKAIEEAVAYAKKLKLILFIKEHPAERNPLAVKNYLRHLLENNKDAHLTHLSVQELLKLNSTVITINSTVGLEARLLLKDVHFLGRSFYSDLTDSELAKYLNDYVIEVDYHSNNIIGVEKINQILACSKYGYRTI